MAVGKSAGMINLKTAGMTNCNTAMDSGNIALVREILLAAPLVAVGVNPPLFAAT